MTEWVDKCIDVWVEGLVVDRWLSKGDELMKM